MELRTKTDTKISALFSSILKLKPTFASNEEAIQFFSKKMEEISSIKKCTLNDLIIKAEENPTDELFSEALSLARKIQFLKKV